MSNLDVSVTLRLINQMRGSAAASELNKVAAAGKALNGTSGAKLAGDLNRAAAAGGKVTATMRSAGVATATLGNHLSTAAAAGGRIEANLSGATTTIRSAGTAAKGLAADLERAAGAAGRVQRQARDAGGRFARGGGGGGGSVTRREAAATEGGSAILAGGRLGGGIAAGFAVREAARRTIGEAISMEKAWAEVLKKVNDAPNPQAMQNLEQSVRRMGVELGIPREQIAKIAAEAGAAGTKFEDIERFVRLAAKASVGWDMSQEDAAQKLAEIRTGTGMTIAQLEETADKINALGDNSAAKERDIVEMFGRSAAAAKEAGVSYDTSLAMLTAVRSAGMQPEVVSRWFNAFAGGLRTIQDGKKGAKEALKDLGLDADKVAMGMQRDSLGTMLDLFKRLSEAPDAARASVKLFGKEWWDETSRAKGTTPTIMKMLEVLQSPTKYQGSLDKNLAVQMNTTAKHLDRLKVLSQDVGDHFGRWTLPYINRDIQWTLAKVDELQRRLRVREAGAAPSDGKDLPLDLRIQDRDARNERDDALHDIA